MDSRKQAELQILDRTLFDNVVVKALLRLFFRMVFKLTRWKELPNQPEGAGVTIAAPHTSNWGIFYAFGAAVLNNVKIYFSIKESWCRVPIMGAVIRYMGAIPINRSSNAQGQVEKIKTFVERNKNSRVFFLFTPEGTRSLVSKWKTGFYHVAEDTGLPIFLAKVDYQKKESGVFHSFTLTGNKEQDIQAIQSSYKSVCARFPDLQYPVYTGPLPKLSLAEEKIIAVLYELKGMATQAEINAKAKVDALTTEMLEYLVEKGILEKVSRRIDGRLTYNYQLTTRGTGFAFHMQPA